MLKNCDFIVYQKSCKLCSPVPQSIVTANSRCAKSVE